MTGLPTRVALLFLGVSALGIFGITCTMVLVAIQVWEGDKGAIFLFVYGVALIALMILALIRAIKSYRLIHTD